MRSGHNCKICSCNLEDEKRDYLGSGDEKEGKLREGTRPGRNCKIGSCNLEDEKR